jgi:integrase
MAALRFRLDKSLLNGIDFERRIIGADSSGRPQTEPTPEGVSDWIIRDKLIPGLGVRVSRGAVAFFVQRKMGGSESVKRTMGAWPTMTLDLARKRAQYWLGLMADGKDPLVEKGAAQERAMAARREARRTMGHIFADYIEIKGRGKESTTKDRQKVEKWLEDSPLWRTAVNKVTVEILEETLDPLFDAARNPKAKKPSWGPKSLGLATAWKCFRYTQAAYNLALSRDGIEARRGMSPFAALKKSRNWPLPSAKESYLNTGEEEGEAWIKSLDGLRSDPRPQVAVFADYILCLLLWGGRRVETQRMKWADIDFKENIGSFVAENTKSGRAHYFPITPWAREILLERKIRNEAWGERGGEWVFPSRQHGKPIADHRSALEELKAATGLWITAHDLRRTMATDTAGQTQNILLVAAALNHAGGAKVTRGYIQNVSAMLRPIYERRERELRAMAGLANPEQADPFAALIAFLENAKRDPAQNMKIGAKVPMVLGLLSG